MDPTIACLLEEIATLNPMQSDFVKTTVAMLTSAEEKRFLSYVEFLQAEGYSLRGLAECYDFIVKDMVKEQIYFRRNGRYRFSSFKEVGAAVYHNSEYMTKYMHGLALTAFLWPNHVALGRWFEETLPQEKRGRYLEIGPGHGCNFLQAMLTTAYDHFDGIDVSEASVVLTKAIIESNRFGSFRDFSIENRDFLSMSTGEKYEAIVMGEVLEHVEDPSAFLQQIAELSHEGTHIFVSTVINSPAIDHIYLFETVTQLRDSFRLAGLRVTKELILPYAGTTMDRTVSEKLPMNVAFCLQKMRG